MTDRYETDPLRGLPDDLARVLRDPSIIVPQDASVFELVAKWAKAPSNTASAARPTHGVRIARGFITHWKGEPITSRSMAAECLGVIEEWTGEHGAIEECC